MPKSRSYAELAAGLRVEPTFSAAEAVLKKDYPLKLPDRRWIQLWNTPELSEFRGYQEELDATEERQHQARMEKEDIRTQAREAGLHQSDMDWVGEQATRMRQSAEAVGQQVASLDELHRRELEGMAAETRAELQRLSNAQLEQANRSRIAEEALLGVRDTLMEDRARLGRMAEGQGVTHNTIDQSVVNNVHNEHHHSHVTDLALHNQVQNLLHTHAQQFGAHMEQ